MESKHAEVWGHFFQYGSIDDGQIGMHLGKTEHSMHFDTDTEMPTEIVFPKHDHRDGWQIFATDCCKYTVRICLINKRVK